MCISIWQLVFAKFILIIKMLRKEIYLRELHAQHKEIMQTAARGYLTIDQKNNALYSPANCLLGFTNELATSIINRRQKSQLDYTYLIVALQLTNQSYHQHLSQFKLAFPNIDHLQTINKLVQYFTNNSPSKPIALNKQSIRRKFQKLIGKAEVEGYFRIPEVPAFLVSTNWLEKLYSSEEGHPGPIRNQILLQSSDFPLSTEKYWHFNYKIRADVRENQDFKVVPYEAWKLLQQTYGGVEVRRYTTRQKVSTVQIWYSSVSFWIIEQMCILAKIQLQVSKNQSLQQTMERLKLTLQKYKAIPKTYLERQPTFYKVKGLQADQFSALLHSEAHNQILAQKMEKIGSLNLDFEELSLFSNRQALVVNYNVGASNIFGKVKLLKTIQLKQRCLKCGTNEQIQFCKCKTVYFCSKKCREASSSHFRQCDSIQSQGRKYKTVTQYYDVKRRCFPQVGDIISFGKVGFENLGNTCYMNAAVQCVMRLEPLMRYFLTNEHLKDLNVSNVLGSEGYLACSFGELVKSYYTTKQRSIEAAAVLRIIARNAQFRGYNHQDSQEFLNYFLDKLHEDLNRVKVKPYTEQVQSNGRPDEVVSQLSWENYLKRNFSLITDLLAGQYRSEIRCPDCQKISITFDPFLSLTLQFPRPEKGTILQGFYMTDEGQFQKVSVEVKPAMNTYEFYEKYFHTPVKAVQQIDKKIAYEWNPNLSLFQNKKDKGSIFFYDKPLGHAVQIQIQYVIDQKTPNFIRIVFVRELADQEQLLQQIYKAIRKPIQKALGKDTGPQGYQAICKERSFVKILSLNKEPNQQFAFPITGIATVKVKALIDLVKLKASPVKLNIQSGTYDGKVQTFVRKVGNVLTIQQLLHCFSQPERLTQQNAWYCNVCKDHKLADKAMQLYRLPQYLIVHLKRFNHSGNRFVIYGEKVSTAIDLEEFEIIKGKRYELIGIVNHIGSLMHGHYTAMVKRDGWFNYDDSRCSKTQMDGRNAYLLFYKLAQ